MTPEGKVEAHLVKRVKETGGKTRKLRWIGRRSACDRLVWWVFPNAALIEVKRPGEEPTKAQAREHRLMSADGWPVFWVDSKEMVDDLISRLTAPQ